MQIKISIFLAVLGLLISILCGLVVDNHLSHILMVSFLSALGMGLLGIAIGTILDKNVPEVADTFSGGDSQDYNEYEEDNFSTGNTQTGVSIEGEEIAEQEKTDPEDDSMTPPPPTGKKDGNYGDHIVVDNVPIKNEPKLMAEAIRTMMANDDES